MASQYNIYHINASNITLHCDGISRIEEYLNLK